MKILIADDDKTTRSLLSRWTRRWNYETVTATRGDEALRILLADPEIRICVLDWMMPGLNGPEICRLLREERGEPYVYALLLTAKSDTEDVVEGLQAGADDYIHKPCHPLELEVRLRVGQRLADLHRNLVAAREQLRFEATHDALTQLLNRRAVSDELERAFLQSRERSVPLAAIMVDVDHFKSINDNYGHHGGDLVLVEVATRLRREAGPDATVARFGGEEFLVVLPEFTAKTAQALAEKLRLCLQSESVVVGQLGVPVSASFGVAGTDQLSQSSANVLVRAADAALYRSKEAGRNRVTVAQSTEFTRPSMPVSGSAA